MKILQEAKVFPIQEMLKLELHQAPAPQLQHLPLQQQQGKAGVGSQSF